MKVFYIPLCPPSQNNVIELKERAFLFVAEPEGLIEHNDPAFAQQCREAIFGTKGSIVQFPKTPTGISEAEEVIIDESHKKQSNP